MLITELGPASLQHRFKHPKGKRQERIAAYIRMCVKARLQGYNAVTIAQWLLISPHTVRGYLRLVGQTCTESHWQHGGYFAYPYLLAALGLTDEELLRTGATRCSVFWSSIDTPDAPGMAGARRAGAQTLAATGATQDNANLTRQHQIGVICENAARHSHSEALWNTDDIAASGT